MGKRTNDKMGFLIVLLWVLLVVTTFGVPGAAWGINVGEPAPDFTLPSTTGEKIALSAFRGKQMVLLEFYGADFSPVWAKNLSARKADYSKFQDLNVQVLGISANNPFSQKAFAESLKLPFPLLSDFPDLKVIRSYGGLSEELSLTVAQRWLFLIDAHGIVRGRWKGNTKEVIPTEIVLKTVKEVAKE